MRQKKGYFSGETLFPDISPTDINLDDTHKGNWVESSPFAPKSGMAEDFLGPSLRVSKIKLFFIFCIGALILLFLRTVQLQLVQGSSLLALSQKNTIKTVIIPAHRGILFDRNGFPLVQNTPNFIVQVQPHEFLKNENFEDLVLILSRSIGEREQFVIDTIRKAPQYQPLVLKEHVKYDTALSLLALFSDTSGIDIVVSEGREYQFHDALSLSHIIGYGGRISEKELEKNKGIYQLTDSVGKEGLERYYENVLRGLPGKKQIEVDALGSRKGVIGEELPHDGKNIVLTIDKNLQQKSEYALQDVLKKFKKTKGVVIISKAHTGEILSLVSMPFYDSNEFAKGISRDQYHTLITDIDKPLYNRAVYGEYPSGSTIKPVVVAAALQEGVVTEKTVISSTGGIRIGEWFFPDWKAGGHGATTAVKAIAESVNTFFYLVGGGYEKFQGLGVERLVFYLKKFGFGQPIGIDLIGEQYGFVPDPTWKRNIKKESWYIGDTYHISIGQGDLLVTPLQINNMTSYFANGGKSFVFHLAKEINSSNEHAKEDIQEKIYKENVVSQEHTNLIRKGMRQTVLSGSGRRLATLSVPVAGKTGTAQWGKGRVPHAWFTGWAPYEKPQIVFTVLIEEGEEGSRTAIVVAEDILKWYFDPARLKLLLTKPQ